jgi:hypothetical protein
MNFFFPEPLLSKLGFEFTLFCHPELVSGSQMALFYEMLNQVQHDGSGF